MGDLIDSQEYLLIVIGKCNRKINELVAKMQKNPKVIAAAGYVYPYFYDSENMPCIEGFAYFDTSNGERMSLKFNVSFTSNSYWEFLQSIDLETRILSLHSIYEGQAKQGDLPEILKSYLDDVTELIGIFEARKFEEWLS